MNLEADNPFAYINAITGSKEDFTSTDEGEANYPAYMVNRGLSYFRDTVLQANEMNRYYNVLPNALQNQFLLNSIAPRKRFSKWFKSGSDDGIRMVAEYYGYSYPAAKQVFGLHSPEQLDTIKEHLNKGGRS